MALRLLLVALVASLGFELPSGEDLTDWSRTGRSWVGARMADLASIGSQTPESPGSTEVADSRSATADLTFDVVVEKLAIDFTADLAANPRSSVDPSTSLTAEDMGIEAGSEGAPIAGRLERLTSAVRLTQQAIEAWRILVQGSSNPISLLH